MALLDNDNPLRLFGLEITKKKAADTNSAAISLPIDDDGSAIATAASGAAYYGIYMDVEGATKNELLAIQKYREISLFPEIDVAIQDIINEAVPQEDEDEQIELDLSALEYSDELKEKIRDEFDKIVSLVRYNRLSADIFRRWYIDGRLFFQIIVNKEHPEFGIQELRPIDAMKIKKVKEVKKEKTAMGVDAITDIQEYFIYSESGFGATAQNQVNKTAALNVQGVKLSPDAVIYVPSGYVDPNTGSSLGYLHKAIRPVNQLRMLEDATAVYFIARAPERRIFYVDVGNLPKMKAEQYLKDIMNRYRNKMVYDSKTGEVKDDKKYMSMLEDFWMPRRDGGKGTEITTLPGASNITGQLEVVDYFQKKLYQALNIPVSRLQPDTGFSLGRTTEVSRDELKFQKFIDKLRLKFSQLFFDSLKIQLVLKGICNTEEWEDDLRDNIRIVFQKDNYFTELKDLDVLQARMAIMPQVDPYLGKYFSKKYVQTKILRMSDEEIIEMDEQIDEEKGDPTAQPSFAQGGMGMDPNAAGMMGGGDPSMGQGGGDPYAQDGQEDDGQSQYPFQQ